VVLECRLIHALDLGVHTLFVGEVLEMQADEAVLGPGGLPDIALLRPWSTPRGRWPTTRSAPPGDGLPRGQGLGPA